MGGEEERRKKEELMMEDDGDDDEVELPGFRFHPTDEELVGFYLRRQLDKKPIRIELIKQIDIYKYDPWDLPKASYTGGEKEWYFFCKRGRKYRNSIRPNRVTGSGFWKATGIDKPVYSLGGTGSDCIGLKKTLVYYKGSAGKGTKTDWMMHEFRLPSHHDASAATTTTTTSSAATAIAQEAEIWTLCRIFKRNVPPRKHLTDWRSSSQQATGSKRQYSSLADNKNNTSSRLITSTLENDHHHTNKQAYINFGGTNHHHHHGNYYSHHHHEQKPAVVFSNIDQTSDHHDHHQFMMMNNSHQQPAVVVQQQPQLLFTASSLSSSSSNLWINNHNPSSAAAAAVNDFFTCDENWDELGSVVKFALDSSIM